MYEKYKRFIPAGMEDFFQKGYDQGFIDSEAYDSFLKNIARGMTGKKIRVKFIQQGSDLAYTEGKTVYINKHNALFDGLPLYVVVMCHIAMIVHEISHIMHTNFSVVRRSQTKSGKETPEVVKVKGDLFNLTEDSRIERINSFMFPGYAPCLYLMRQVIYDVQQPDVSQSQEETEIFYNLRERLWEYMMLGTENTELVKEAKKYWKKIKPIARKARREDQCTPCYKDTLKILKILKPLIPQNYTPMPELNSTGSIYPNKSDTNAECMQDSILNDEDQNSSSQSGEEQNGKSSVSANEDEEETGKSSAGNQEDSDSSKNYDMSDPENDGSDSSEEVADNSSGNGGNENMDNFSEMLNDLKESLEAVVDEYNKELKEEAADYITNSKNMQITRTQDVIVSYVNYDSNDSEKYYDLLAACKPIINTFKMRLKKILNYNQDEVLRKIGRGKVDGKSLTNLYNGRICRKLKEKSDEADLNFTVLIDASGSMEGERSVNTIATTAILIETAEALGIPISVMSFTSRGYNCLITFFKHFKHKRKTKHSITRYAADGYTPLGEAVEYILKFQKTVPQTDKVVVVVTDGEPDNFVTAKAAINKLKKDSLVYGVSIGEDAIALQQLFGKNFITVNNLKSMPAAMCGILQKNLLKE